MRALFNFFDENEKAGLNDYHLATKRLPNGDFKFFIQSVSGEKIVFICSRVGLTPLDNRGILGDDA
jgi:hypothetical protein